MLLKTSIISTLLLPVVVSSYRLLEYSGTQCSGAQTGIFRLAGPSACTNLDYGISESVLVKIDNVNDNKYDVEFFTDENCAGIALQTVSNANACINIFNEYDTNQNVKSVIVRRPNGSSKRSSINGTITNTDFEMNYDWEDSEYHTPIAPGVFVPVGNTTSENGTFIDPDDFLSSFINNSNMPAKQPSSLNVIERDEIEKLKELAGRDLTPAMCQLYELCIDNIQSVNGYGAVKWAKRMGNKLRGIPWKSLAKGTQIFIDQLANGATLYSTFSTTNTQSMQCDTNYDTGALVEDSMTSAASESNYTSLIMEFCSQDKGCFQYAEYLYLKSKSGGTKNGKGNC